MIATDGDVAGRGDAPSLRSVIEWLRAIKDRRDLTLPAPLPTAAVRAIESLLDTLSRDFSDYHDVVTGARAAAQRNAKQLESVVRSTAEQGKLARATADAATEAGDGGAMTAQAATKLLEFAQAAAKSAANADTGLAEICAALGQLGARLNDGNVPLADMQRSTDGVAEFIVTLGRLSRNAQLLAVNASIEAAHLAEAGSRFAIVAQEVRKLSTSTRESRAEIARIVVELRESTAQVAAAADDSSEATVAAATEIDGAGKALARTGRGITNFEEMVVTVADVAATQSVALQAVKESIDQLARHADGAAHASRDASRLDLDALLATAERTAAYWTLRRPATSAALGQDPFAQWIGTIIGGADAALQAPVDDDPDLSTLAAAVRSLLDAVHADQRDVLGDVVQVALAVSRNGYAWRAIAEALAGVRREIQTVRETVDESTRGARTSAELALGMRDLVETIRAQYDEALASLEDALTRISRIAGSVRAIDGFVESMNSAAERADHIMALIETLSSETDLLSLNAAIEAAHAGEQGRGFSVIAEEIRSLARSTNDATVGVSELVASVTLIGTTLRTTIGGAASSTLNVTASAEGVRGAISSLGDAFAAATRHALEVTANATDQTQALERVLDNVSRTASAFDSNSRAASDKGQLELAKIGSRAHAIAARRPIGTVIERVRAFGETLCVALEATIESALASRRLSLDRLFDLRYHCVTGAEIQSFARLFDVSRVPGGGFNPPKFATPWDAAIDEAINDVLEAAYDRAAAFSPVAIFISDLNGFFYAYPRRKIAAWTNDFATDNTGNRIKRMFEDEYALRVGRWGLGRASEELGARCAYDAFVRAGCMLQRTEHRPWGGYVYARDTNMVCNEVVMALYAREKRHSTLRICYDPELI